MAKASTTQTNHTLTYRKDHPGNRCSYGIAGVPGLVVIDKRLFADGQAPPTITVDCSLALPQPKAPATAPKVAPAAATAPKAPATAPKAGPKAQGATA